MLSHFMEVFGASSNPTQNQQQRKYWGYLGMYGVLQSI
jgi:hypothetical protein